MVSCGAYHSGTNEFLITFASLKRFVSILLLFTFLISGTECSQLLKLPELVHHYSEHRQQNKSITFWEFLLLHYAQGNAGDTDRDRDAQLPFKSHEGCAANIELACHPLNGHPLFQPPAVQFRESLNYLESSPPNEFHNGIWQPPRSC